MINVSSQGGFLGEGENGMTMGTSGLTRQVSLADVYNYACQWARQVNMNIQLFESSPFLGRHF